MRGTKTTSIITWRSDSCCSSVKTTSPTLGSNTVQPPARAEDVVKNLVFHSFNWFGAFLRLLDQHLLASAEQLHCFYVNAEHFCQVLGIAAFPVLHFSVELTMFLFWIIVVQHIAFLHLLHDSSPLLLLLHLPSPSLAPPPPRLDWWVIIPRQYLLKLPPIDDDVGGGGGGGGGASLLTPSDFLLLVLSDVPKLLLFVPVTESGAG